MPHEVTLIATIAAAFGLAMVFGFIAVRLKLPVESMKGDLAAKVRFFRQAQQSFIDALNVRHSYWARQSTIGAFPDALANQPQ